jgi:hypothetical protein
MLKRRLAVFVCCLFVALPVRAEDVASRDWSANATPSLTSQPPKKEDVESFVGKELGSDWAVKLCDYGFADIGGTGTNYLLASIDVNRKHSCNRIVVIGKVGGTISVIHDFKAAGVEDIHKILYADKGGTVMVFPEHWGIADGVSCQPKWLRVYQWQDGHFIDRSKAYPDIYKNRLKQIIAALPKLEEHVCFQMEGEKIARFLGLDPRAGYTRALGWMKSPSSSLRRKAASVFADIGGNDSDKNLVILENDPDPLVAGTAKLYRDSETGDSKE